MLGLGSISQWAISYFGLSDAPPVVSTVTNVTVAPVTTTQAVGTIQFAVTVNGTNGQSQATTAIITGAGSINSSNLYMLPSQTDVTQIVTITWTSLQDPVKPPGVATVTIPASGTVQPDSVCNYLRKVLKASKLKITRFR